MLYVTETFYRLRNTYKIYDYTIPLIENMYYWY